MSAGKSFDPSPPCFALCSVLGQWEVLGIPIPTPPDVDLLSSMTNQLNGCPHFFVFVSYTFFLKIDCDLQIMCYLCRERRFQLSIGCGYTRVIYIYPVLCPKLTLIQPTWSAYPYHLVFLIWYPYSLVFLIWYPYAPTSLYGNTAHCSGYGVAMGCYGLFIVTRTGIVTS